MTYGKMQLYTKILIGMLAGVVLGLAAHHWGFSAFVLTYVKPVGTLFIRLISMIVVPLVFASLVVGTASLDNVRELGRIGTRTLVFYLCTTVIAISGGLLLANLLRPGQGLNLAIKAQLLQQSEDQVKTYEETLADKPTVIDVLLDIVPRNPIRALVDGNMLQVIFFALMFGICLALMPEAEAGTVKGFFEGVNAVMIQIVHLVMRMAPYGVFALMAAVIADFGVGILLVLFKYAMVVIVGLCLHMVVVYPLAIRLLSRVRVPAFFTGMRPAQLIAFSSGSSSATLPVTLECVCETLGVPLKIGGFVLPLGATINMDGTALFQGVSAVFIAQVYGLDLSLVQQVTVVLTATLASIGTSGTPGAGMVTLAIVLRSIGIPVEGIGLIFGVERLLDMCRTVVNITGDACCAVVVANREIELGTGLLGKDL
ncbi:MAG: dicarboxylate/amino acid:cation symporter [Phycisphaerae bacterium]|nr:dicarboxylate/amino acid:cation symporter [Phycisphaerae bacterium]